MDDSVKAVMEDCTRASDEERMSFPEVVGRMMAASVESYHTDMLRAERTFYMPDGESYVVPTHRAAATPARDFVPAGVEAAIRATQSGRIGYRDFCEDILRAGCVGYIVSFPGRRAVYFGRTGDFHVEQFPPAP